MKRLALIVFLAAAIPVWPAQAEEIPASAEAPAGEQQALNDQVQDLKKQVLELNRDLFVLEEELLFPSSTQVAVFVSMDVGVMFALDSVKLKIGGNEVANYLYTDRELEALQRGGVHRIYTGNLKTGKHELVAFFTGRGPNDRDYRRGADLVIDKGLGPKYIELKIVDSQIKQQPTFAVREWE
jgi:hypothetical protein